MAPLKVRCMDHINMDVSNLAESVDFYRRLFGFEIKEDHSNDDKEPWVILGEAGVVYLCLYEHPDKKQDEDALSINHFGLVLSDFNGALQKLEEMGVEILYGGLIDWPHSRSIYISDPNGHKIELAEKVGGDLH